MDGPLVNQLSRQWHGWVAMSGKDNHWKHLSGKPASRLVFPPGSNTGLRPHVDYVVDRLMVQAQQCVEPTSTNRSRGLAINQKQTYIVVTKIYKLIAASSKLIGRSKTVSLELWAKKFPGNHSTGATPVPISNTVVKPCHADDTARAIVWESR